MNNIPEYVTFPCETCGKDVTLIASSADSTITAWGDDMIMVYCSDCRGPVWWEGKTNAAED